MNSIHEQAGRAVEGAVGGLTENPWHVDTVYILGAGFSHAAFPQFPLTDDLGKKVATALVRDGKVPLADSFKAGVGELGFENYLSSLAERHPHQDEYEWHLAQGLLYASLPQIADQIIEIQRTIDPETAPWWLRTLLELIVMSSAGMVTFNYDTLVEALWPRYWAPATRSLGVHPTQGVIFLDAGLDGSFARSSPTESDCGLYKLHGSVNWIADPADQHGATLRIDRVDLELEGYRLHDRGYIHDGTAPVIVPPTSAKGQALQRAFVAGLWKSARARIERASRVVLVGYSLPQTDRASLALLRDASVRAPKDFVVVDIDGAAVAERVKSLGGGCASVAVFDGPNAIEDYVESELCRVSEWLTLEDAEVRLFSASEVYPLVSGPTLRDGVIGIVASGDGSSLAALSDADGKATYRDIAQLVAQPCEWLLRDPTRPGTYLPVWHVDKALTDAGDASSLHFWVGSPVPLDKRTRARRGLPASGGR